jgi:hypothetical protein
VPYVRTRTGETNQFRPLADRQSFESRTGAAAVMTIPECRKALDEIRQYLQWEEELLERYHDYARMFGAPPATNVFRYVLVGALTFRGMTLAQFDELRKKL